MSVELTRALLKIGVMIAFFIIVMVFGTLPLRSRTFKKRPLLRALGATFAGCLFINVAILHILPEAADTLQ
jgi:zinc transporter 1/2/3